MKSQFGSNSHWAIMFDNILKKEVCFNDYFLDIDRNVCYMSFPYIFRLLNSNGIICFHGRSSSRDTNEAFYPLDHAEQELNCTDIQYLQDDGSWQSLI